MSSFLLAAPFSFSHAAPHARARTADLTEDQRVTLQLFERTFKSYIMESETARQERRRATELEGQLERARNDLVLGAHLPTQDGNPPPHETKRRESQRTRAHLKTQKNKPG